MHLLPLLLYLATVALSTAVAYDPALAWKPAALLTIGAVASLGIAAGGRRWGDRLLTAVGAGCALLAAAVGGYFLLSYDWIAAGEGKFAAIQQAGLWIQAHRPALPLPEDINGNVAGAALALLLPIGVTGLSGPTADSRQPTGRAFLANVPVGCALRRIVCAVALAIGALALALTGSRGAWAGIVAGGVAAGALAVVARRWPSRFKITTVCTAALLFLTALGLMAAVIAWPGADRLLGNVTGAGNSVLSRAQLWRDGLTLIGDYPFTGSGAGSAMMVYSSYAMLLHVGYISHAHNLFLHIALEQGLPGLAAFLGLLAMGWAAIAKRREAQEDVWRLAAAAGLTALMVHGVADAGIYTSYLAPVLFLPIGLALGTVRPVTADRRPTTDGRQVAPAGGTIRIWTIAVLAGLVLLALLPPMRAAFQANLAAVAQTRAELATYRWPEYPIQDALRRQAPNAPPPVDLTWPIARYRAALALDPRNVTANRRLGQIELSLGAYEAARGHLEAAYAVAPWQRPTRQLLGEVYTLAGERDRTAELWHNLDFSQGQLALRKWWYETVGEGW